MLQLADPAAISAYLQPVSITVPKLLSTKIGLLPVAVTATAVESKGIRRAWAVSRLKKYGTVNVKAVDSTTGISGRYNVDFGSEVEVRVP